MPDPLAIFRANMNEADTLAVLYDHLSATVVAPVSFDDLLRSSIVYSVSAFDKLMHDLIRIGMVDTYAGRRSATPKFLNEPIPLSVVQQLISPGAAPPEVVFEQCVRSKLKTQSFQDPDKIAEGLGFIWSDSHKWQKIAAQAGIGEATIRTTLKLIVARRNAIVHEADTDPVSELKLPITRAEASGVSTLLRIVGEAIHQLVK